MRKMILGTALTYPMCMLLLQYGDEEAKLGNFMIFTFRYPVKELEGSSCGSNGTYLNARIISRS